MLHTQTGYRLLFWSIYRWYNRSRLTLSIICFCLSFTKYYKVTYK